MSVPAWATLQRTFFKGIPAKVTNNYLATALSMSEKTAGNILPQLRNIGLIDNDGVPTELATELRFEASYAAACKTIVTTIYPDELRDLFPDADADVEKVAEWFMRHSGSGLGFSKNAARFYLHLLAGKLPGEDVAPRATKGNKSSARKPTPKVAQAPVTPAPSVQEAVETHPQDALAQPKARHQGGPSLHIDMQVHIDPASTPEQIDSIFASMAKHLYGR